MTNTAEQVIGPVFGDKEDVVVFFSANAHFVPVMSCVLQSLCENASASRRYDIIILASDIPETAQEVLRAQVAVDNISLRFCDFSENMNRFVGLRQFGHFRIETYFRLLIPELAPWCKKALYLDADITVNHDVAELFDVDVENYLVAAAHDPYTAGQYCGFDGRPSMLTEHNPSGSQYAVECITSPDGRIIGRMGHVERCGENLCRNVPGNYSMRFFEGAYSYFMKS